MTRRFWLVLHRYAGLGMAVFLVLVGLTGSVLAFHQELDDWLNPDRDRVPVRAAPLLDPFVLRDRAQARVPEGYSSHVDLRVERDRVYEITFQPPIDPATGKPRATGYVALKLDPYTGEELARSDPSLHQPSFWPLHRGNILDFVWQLHVQLALGHVGGLMLGIVALVWFIDCFVSFYLTLPGGMVFARNNAAAGKARNASAGRWWKAWKVKWPASSFRLNFDLHRAGGLWTWAMLFMFAWSSGTFNLPAVFHPINDFLFGERPEWKAVVPQPPQPDRPIDLRAAHAIGRQLMDEQARLHGFHLLQERYVSYNPDGRYYSFGVNGDELFGGQDTTYIAFDADRREVLYLYMPSGLHASVTLINWLSGLHTAAIWGRPYQIVVCVMGLVITLLSVTGIYIWWRKRRAHRQVAKLRPARSSAQAGTG